MSEPDGPTSLERAQGCLLGLAVGDALGAPLAYLSREQASITHGTVEEMIGGGWLGLRPGETTDETALALALAESIVAKQGYDAEDAAGRYVAWYRTGPKAIGNTTRAALARIAETGRVEGASAHARDALGDRVADNGALVRAVPLAIVLGKDLDALARATLADARITHAEEEAVLGAVLLAVHVAVLLWHETDRAAARERVAGWLETNELAVYDILPEYLQKGEDDLRPTAAVVDTLETALWSFAHARSFESCLVGTVNLGGAADTTGAIAGALAGVRFGVSGIPDRWRGALVVRGKTLSLAGRLHGLAGGMA